MANSWIVSHAHVFLTCTFICLSTFKWVWKKTWKTEGQTKGLHFFFGILSSAGAHAAPCGAQSYCTNADNSLTNVSRKRQKQAARRLLTFPVSVRRPSSHRTEDSPETSRNKRIKKKINMTPELFFSSIIFVYYWVISFTLSNYSNNHQSWFWPWYYVLWWAVLIWLDGFVVVCTFLSEQTGNSFKVSWLFQRILGNVGKTTGVTSWWSHVKANTQTINKVKRDEKTRRLLNVQRLPVRLLQSKQTPGEMRPNSSCWLIPNGLIKRSHCWFDGASGSIRQQTTNLKPSNARPHLYAPLLTHFLSHTDAAHGEINHRGQGKGRGWREGG